MEQVLLTWDRPSDYFRTLRQAGQLEERLPELAALIGVEQAPEYHPEGDVWEHTMLVLDEAAKLRHLAKKPLAFMLSALCHDLGKAQTTWVIDGRIRALGHEQAGMPLAKQLLNRLCPKADVEAYVLNMVELHMRPNMLAAQGAGAKATRRLYRTSVCPEDLLLLAKADHFGRTDICAYEKTERYLQDALEAFHFEETKR